MEINLIFQIFVLLFSIIIHEVSHGLMAYAFGDRTAEYSGRLTLNPVKHIDLFGSIILPLILWLSNAGFMIGWAKPVPYNPYNLRNAKVAEPLIAFAGPASNIIIAVIFGLIIRFEPTQSDILLMLFAYIVSINIALAIFNLIPIPPLDGSKILFSFFPNRFVYSEKATKYGFISLIFIIMFFPDFISPTIRWFFKLLIGM